MKNIYLLSLVLLTLGASCSKKVEEVNRDYLGTWQNENFDGELLITTGTSRYRDSSGSGISQYEGRARIKGDEEALRIGFKKFDIDQPPMITEVEYFGIKIERLTMILDGEVFVHNY